MKPTISIILLAAIASRVEANPAHAEVLFREAMALMEQGKLAEACAAFAASQRTGPSVKTLVNLAICRERNGQYATAWGLYLEAVRQTRGVDEQTAQAAYQMALDKTAELEPRVSKLTINVSAESRVELLAITQNGVALDEATWNRSLPVDGGTYTITARAPGSTEWSTTIQIAAERDIRTVDIPKLQIVTKTPALSSPVVAQRRVRMHVFPIGGGALAALGLGVGLEVSARSTYDRAQREPDATERNSLWRSANTQRYAAEAFAITGLACAGVAVWLYVRGRRDDSDRVAVHPIVDGNRAGIGVIGRFR